jgi:hypothetical protein
MMLSFFFSWSKNEGEFPRTNKQTNKQTTKHEKHKFGCNLFTPAGVLCVCQPRRKGGATERKRYGPFNDHDIGLASLGEGTDLLGSESRVFMNLYRYSFSLFFFPLLISS